jgi:hypothetical protein
MSQRTFACKYHRISLSLYCLSFPFDTAIESSRIDHSTAKPTSNAPAFTPDTLPNLIAGTNVRTSINKLLNSYFDDRILDGKVRSARSAESVEPAHLRPVAEVEDAENAGTSTILLYITSSNYFC